MKAVRIFKSLWRPRESMVFQLGAWALAVALCVTLAAEVRELSRADSLREQLALPNMEVRNLPLRKEDYLAVRERVGRAYSERSVQLLVSEEGVTVKAHSVADYAEWRLALADVMLSMPGAVWSVKKLCAGERCPEGAYSVTLNALVRNFAVSLPRADAPAAATPVTAPNAAPAR